MSEKPIKQPPFTDCPKTEKVFPFKRMDESNWYRYQSDAIDLCEKLERENAYLRALLKCIRQNNWDAFELASQIEEVLAETNNPRG